jgi:transcription antitermination protein NusB
MSAPESRRGGRPKARDLVMRVLYEADLTGDDPREILDLAFGRFRFTEEGRRHALRLVDGFLDQAVAVDAAITAQLQHWDLERLGAVERAILRLATVELLLLPELPAAVILEEALRLAHRYADPASAPFVNGVLDAIARAQRPEELAPPAPRD